MIFDNSFKEQNFIKPRLGTDNMFFKRSGDMTTFGRVGSTLAPLIGAAYGGKKGAEMAGSAFGALASLGMSKTAEDDLYDESLADMDKKNAIGQLVGTGVDFVNDIGKRAATAIATGGTSEVTRAVSNIQYSSPTSAFSQSSMALNNNIPYSSESGLSGLSGFTPNNGIPYSSQTSVQANPITGTYMDRAKANPLANFALGKIAPIAQFKDGGILKSMRSLKKKSDSSEDIDMYDKETGEKVGEMRYDERIFSQMDTKKMEKLASQGKLEQLGKLVKDSIERQEYKEQGGMIMAQDGGKPKEDFRPTGIEWYDNMRRNVQSRYKGSDIYKPESYFAGRLIPKEQPMGSKRADSATMSDVRDIYASIGATLPPAIVTGINIPQQQAPATQRQATGGGGGASRPSNRTTGTKTAPTAKPPVKTNPMASFRDLYMMGTPEVMSGGNFASIEGLQVPQAPAAPISDNTAPTTPTSVTSEAQTKKSLMDRLKDLRNSKMDDADANRRMGNLADSATALYQTIRGSRIDLPTFEPNAQYLEYGNRLGQMAQSGLPASQDAQLRSQLDRQSAMTMGQLANIGGGSQGAALGVLSNMAQGTQGAVAQRDLANDQAQMQALGMYGNFLGNQRNQDFAQVFVPQYEQAAADITSTAQSIAALRGNIEARNNFYNTYEDSNSPYRRMIESQISSIGRTEQNIENESNKLPGQSGVSLYSNVLEDDDATFKALEKSRADLNARNRRVTGTRNLRTR